MGKELRETLVADGTEQFVYVNDFPLGERWPVVILIELVKMVDTEEVVIREYYRTELRGSRRLVGICTYYGTGGGLSKDVDLLSIEMMAHLYGFAITLKQTVFSGAYKSFRWERKIGED